MECRERTDPAGPENYGAARTKARACRTVVGFGSRRHQPVSGEEFAGRVVHASGWERIPDMILRTIAFNTFGTFLRDKILIVVAILFLCGLGLMMTPLLGAKAMASMGNTAAAQSM